MDRRFLNHGARPELVSRADGALPVIVGYAAVFYRTGDPGTEYQLWPGLVERIMPGAFDRTIAGDDIRALFNHDMNKILGRNAAKTLRLSVDAKGLRYEIDPPDSATGRDVIEAVRRGDVSGSSFSFTSRATTYRDVGDITYIERTELQIYDVGPVVYPAYPATEAGIRDDAHAAAVRAEVEAHRRARADADALAVQLAIWEAEGGVYHRD